MPDVQRLPATGELPALPPHCARELAEGIERWKLPVSGDQQQLLLNYLQLLVKWNAAYNLSGIRDPGKMLRLHLLDSLSVLPLLGEAREVLDVGTGAGLPGIPLAICRPDCHFTLLDSNGKKTRFLFHALTTLGLGNVRVVNERIERFQSAEQIDIVVTRAFAPLRRMLDWMPHLIGPDTRLIAMKGQFPDEELKDMPAEFVLAAHTPVQLPGEDCERHLLEVRRR